MLDLFSLDSNTYQNSTLINGIDSVVWVERYQTNGEFTIIGDPTPELRDQLAIGTIISHGDTYEMMMVESHEIDETVDGSPKISITGRSVEVIAMENRVVITPGPPGLTDHDTNLNNGYVLDLNSSWDQIVKLIKDFLQTSIFTPFEELPNFVVRENIDPLHITPHFTDTQRLVKFGILYDAVKDIMNADNVGIRTERPNTSHSTMDWIVHNGNDVSDKVVFNWLDRDLDQARYLWTNKGAKNRALVMAQYYGDFIDPGDASGWLAKDTYVEMSDLNDWYDPATITSDQHDDIFNKMYARGVQAIAQSQNQSILDATISKNNRFAYRHDYGVGDIVYVRGNYGVNSKMRVTEYAETLDKNGKSGFPTLSALPDL